MMSLLCVKAHAQDADRAGGEFVVESAAFGRHPTLAHADRVRALERVCCYDVGTSDLRHLETSDNIRSTEVDGPLVALILIAIDDGQREGPRGFVARRRRVE